MQSNKIHPFDTGGTMAILAALLFWSSAPVFIRYLSEYLDVWWQNMLRYSIASLFWLPYLLFHWIRNQNTRTVWRQALPVALVNVIMQCFWAASIYYLEPAFMSLVNKISLIWAAFFSMVIFPRERRLLRSKRFWSGLILCATGLIGVVIYKDSFSARVTTMGIVLTVCAGFFWAVYAVLARVAFDQIDSRLGFSYIAIFTTIGLAVLTVLFGQSADCLNLPAKVWSATAVSAILNIALSHVFFYIAIKRIGVTIPSIVLLITPFTIWALSYFVFGETLNIRQVLFGLVLITGGAMALWAQEHVRETS